MTLKVLDKKSICLMSTIHDGSSHLIICKPVRKLVLVCDYNNTMRGIDLCDLEMSYDPTLRQQQLYQNFQAIFGSIVVECLCNFKKAKPSTKDKIFWNFVYK